MTALDVARQQNLALGVTLDAVGAELAAKDARIAELEAQLRPPTLYGCSVPILGLSKVTEFEAKTQVPLQIVRTYPGPNVLEASLGQTRKVIAAFPGRSICFNSKTAGRTFTATQLTAFVKAMEVEAVRAGVSVHALAGTTRSRVGTTCSA